MKPSTHLPLSNAASPGSEDHQTAPVADPDARELLSRLADGDGDAGVTVRGCAAWGGDAAAREAWHAYQLIGDVLRSPELRPSSRGDAAFLADLRARLADEPVIVAPTALAPAAERPEAVRLAIGRRRWTLPVALAAGFMAALALVVVMRAQTEAVPADAEQLAEAQPSTLRAAATPDGQLAMIRDARLDRYLQAHHGMRVGATAALPGGGLRNVDMLLPSR